jgi:ERF superfamily
MNEIATITVETPAIVSKIIELASIPGTSPEMFDRLVAWQEREQARQAQSEFSTAMSAAQSEMRAIVRDAVNDQTRSKWATLQAIDDAIRPIYTRHGFSLSFTEVANDGPDMKIACIVRRGGHTETFYLSAAPDTVGPQGKPNKTPVQGVGSSVSYLRRYLKVMVFDLALRDDNDGNRQPQRNEDTGELISRAQVAELRALMTETRILESVVLAKKAPGLTTIEVLPAAAFIPIRNDLLSRKNVLAQRAAANIQAGAAA